MIEQTSTNTFLVTGKLDVDNVSGLLEKACRFIDQNTESEITFDFSRLEHSSSAGLALLTSLLRHTQQQKQTIQFLHLPAKLWAAAKISDLDKILPCR